MNTRIKSVEWAYPTSINANRFHKPAGCWCVETGLASEPLKAVAAFDLLSEAVQHAFTLPELWAPWSSLKGTV